MNKVTIAPLDETYCEEYIAMEFDPDVKKYVGGLPKKTKEEMRRQITFGDNQGIYAILENSTGNFIGRCGFFEDDGDKEIYILIAKQYWGKKFAKPAIQELLKITGRKNIFAIIDPENIKSIKLFQSLGFQELSRAPLNGWQNNHLKFKLRSWV